MLLVFFLWCVCVCATYDLYCYNFYLPLCLFSSDLLTFALGRTWFLFRFIEWVKMSVIFTLGMCAYNSCLFVAAIDVTCNYLWDCAFHPYNIFAPELHYLSWYIISVVSVLFFRNKCFCCFKNNFMAYK